MFELNSFLNGMSHFFTESDNSFKYWKSISLMFCAILRITLLNLIYMNRLSNTFLGLDNQQNDK